MNAVLMLAYNNVDLTRAAVESVLAQTIPVHLIVIDNGSTDATCEMVSAYVEAGFSVDLIGYETNTAPTHVTNVQLEYLFETLDYECVLMLANDLVLPPNFYEELLKWPRGIVCGAEIRTRDAFDAYLLNPAPYAAISENTPMSAMLLRRWVYDAVLAKDGHFFDERYFHYASDCDLALRISACGIRGVQTNVPYFHHSSATLNNATEVEGRKMREQADVDRAWFVEKWGFPVFSDRYSEAAFDINFKG